MYTRALGGNARHYVFHLIHFPQLLAKLPGGLMSVKNQLKAGALAFVALFVVVAICTPIANAQNALGLPVSPRSGSSLVGEAIHRGALQVPLSLQGLSVQQNLTCSPLPCVLPNVQASNGTNIANEDPIVSNPRNP